MLKYFFLLYLVATASSSTSTYLRSEEVLEDDYDYASTDMAVGATNTMNQVYDEQELPPPNSEDNEEFDEFDEMDEYEMDDLDNEISEEEGSSYGHEEFNEVVENGIMPRSQNPYDKILDGVRMLLNHCYSFESQNYRGNYIRHRNFELWKDPFNNSDLYQKDSTFKMVPALNGVGGQVSFMSINYKGRYLRHARLGFIHSCGVSDNRCKRNASFKVIKGLSGKYTVSLKSGRGSFFFRHQGHRMKMHKYKAQQLYRDDASFIPHEVPCF